MGNIIGEGFALEISGQVKKRQEIYGSKDRDPQINTFLNSKTGWVRMGSSVDVLIDARNLGLTDNALAKEYVLFNGVSQFTNSGATREIPNQRSGITTSDTLHGNFAYGIGGNEQGLVPMPGITAMSTKTETRGSLKTSTVSIKCYNKIQFDIIDTLYLRLGFTMLLEWGNSSYYNNNGTYEPDNIFNLMDDFLGIGKKYTYSNYYPQIHKRRIQSNGNYDALLGKVVNFDWAFNKDGSYDITVILRSMGDVIESLKANVLLGSSQNILPSAEDYEKQKIEAENELEAAKTLNDDTPAQSWYESAKKLFNITPEITAAKKSISVIETLLEEQETFIGDEEAEGRGGVYANRNASSLGRWIYNNLQKFDTINRKTSNITSSDSLVDDSAFKNGITTLTDDTVYKKVVDKKKVPKSVVSFIRQKYNNDAVSPHYFIHFGYILNFVRNYITPNVGNIDKLFSIDISIEDNLIILANKQAPTDNRICQVSYSKEAEDADGEKINLTYLNEGEDFERQKGENRYGKIMNIYFNVDFVLEAMSKNIKDGKVTLIDFLTELCDGWNDSTGNYSQLSPSFVEESNTLRIIDENALPDRDFFLTEAAKSTTTTYFNIYGYYLNELGQSTAGFISDFSFKTSITPQLATMITVGANSTGNITGEDATGISRMNNGFEDRIKPIITSPNVTPSEQEKETEKKEDTANSIKLQEEFSDTLKNYNQFMFDLGSEGGNTFPTFNPENVEPFKNAVRTLIEYDQSKLTQTKNAQKKREAALLDAKNTKTNEKSKELDSNNYSNKFATASTGFLPFSLSLTMDGLSGMRVYQKFSVDTEFLPSNYPTSLEFLISGIENTISGNKWSTKIESIAIPSNPFSPSTKDTVAFTRVARTKATQEANDKTITSGFPLKESSYQAKSYTKSQIVLHYTAGWQGETNAKETIAFLMTRRENKGLSYHYIIDGAGNVEQLIDSSFRAFHAGNANPNSVGVSLQNIGYGRNDIKNKNGSLQQPNQTPLVDLVGFDGKPQPYRSFRQAQEITDAQVQALKTTFAQIRLENPSIPPFRWNQESFNQLFPRLNPKTKNRSTSYNRAKPGYYTHCSIDTEKFDALPTPKLIAFYKSLEPSLTVAEELARSQKAWLSLVGDILNIYTLKDTFDNGKALLQSKKGVNDSESGAIKLIKAWLEEESQTKRIDQLSTITTLKSNLLANKGKFTDRDRFNKDLQTLLDKTIGNSANDTLEFSLYRNNKKTLFQDINSDF